MKTNWSYLKAVRKENIGSCLEHKSTCGQYEMTAKLDAMVFVLNKFREMVVPALRYGTSRIGGEKQINVSEFRFYETWPHYSLAFYQFLYYFNRSKVKKQWKIKIAIVCLFPENVCQLRHKLFHTNKI